ncbi:MAG: helix-turn-helix domain-containing protein [Streptosporangiales bacterium]|nr:helix-turn-helix domain-containing protein [Streptosporangiales bacterium]
MTESSVIVTHRTDELDDLARTLRLLKGQAGLSLNQLSRRSWYSRSAIDRYLNGKVFPPRQAVASITEICGGDTGAVITLWERACLLRAERRASA